MEKTLEQLLEEIAVHPPGQWENEHGPKDWFAVSDNSGIVAYFGNETAALNFRLHLINAALNPINALVNDLRLLERATTE